MRNALARIGGLVDDSDSILRIKPISLIEPDYMPESFVWWDGITQDDVDSLQAVLDDSSSEAPLQKYLESNPQFLIQHLGGGHGRWVIPQKRLGSEFVPDFVIGERDSMGYHWLVVELESPDAMVFTKAGDPAKSLNHAIRQVTDWRAWLRHNRDYASRDRNSHGLGLVDIDSDVRGLIVIGRRESLDPSSRELRRQLSKSLDVDIHTYDWLVDAARGRVASLSARRTQDAASG